jgi:hypothetical protein
VPLETLVHSFPTRAAASQRERAEAETVATTVSADGVAREPFYQRACSLEREHVATVCPCGSALSGSWSGHMPASAD